MKNHRSQAGILGIAGMGLGVVFTVLPGLVMAGPMEDALDTARRTILNLERVPGQANVRSQAANADADLVLVPFEVFAPGARTHVAGAAKSMPALPKTHYYRGYRASEPGSHVFLAIRPDGSTKGYYQEANVVWALQDAPGGQPGKAIAQRQLNLANEFEGRTFSCGNTQRDLSIHGLAGGEIRSAGGLGTQNTPRSTDTPYVLTVAVETDHEFRQLFGDLAAAQQYIADLFAYVSTLYQAELNTRIQLGDIYLYDDSADPWNATTTLDALNEVRAYWNANRTGISRATTHFLSGKPMGGGIAYVGALCDQWGYGYGVSASLAGDFNIDNPGLVWDAKVVAHEVGHNFNSPHTHCYGGIGGNANPVDTCHGTESGCWSGSAALPGINALTGGLAGWGNGTIMSYCHQRPGGYGNLTMVFGKHHPYGVDAARVPDVMRQYVEATASATPACIQEDASPGVIPTNDLVSALDAPGLEPFTTGSAYWFSQSMVTRDSVDAAQSGLITHGQATTMQSVVTGPGTLSFWWKVSSEPQYDLLGFSIDGVVQSFISGEQDWQEVSLPIAAGSHSLQWRYAKDYSDSAGSDAGWVDQLVYLSEGGLAQAVDSTNLNFTSGGDALWFVQDSVTADGVDAVQSGAIGDNQSSWLQTTVTGPGTLTFKWSVSSEDDGAGGCNDKLAFTLDGAPVDSVREGASMLCGVLPGNPFISETVVVPGGEHVLRWMYSKNGSGAAGDDAGRLDEVVYTVSQSLQLGAASYSVSEGTASLTIPVTRSGGTTGTVSVNYATANGTATAGSDYTAKSGTLTFNAGVSSQNISIPISNDTVAEGNETLTVTLSNPVNAGLGATSQTTVTIVDNDSGVEVVNTSQQVAENGGSVVVQVRRIGATSGSASVSYATANGTATAGADYTARSGTLSWSAGDASIKSVSIPLLNDSLVEGNETFNFNLGTASGAVVNAARKTTVLTLVDDEAGVKLGSASLSVAESAGGAVLTVSRFGNPGNAVSVNYATSNGTATAGVDYLATSGSLQWASGETGDKTLTIPLLNDNATESNETFTLALSGVTGAVLASPGSATVTITDDDNSLQFGAASASATEGAASVTVSVTRVGSAGAPASVSYTTEDGSATAGQDYTAKSGTLNWAAGETASKSIVIPLLNDTQFEGNEAFSVRLSDPAGATLGANANLTVNLADNEAGFVLDKAGYSVGEGTASVVVTVKRLGPSNTSVSVKYATANGTATAGQDYTAASGTLSFSSGVTQKTVSVPILNDTLSDGGDETFTFNLSAPVGGALGTPASATVTILDNDLPPCREVGFGQAKYVVWENQGQVIIPLELGWTDGEAPTCPVSSFTLNYATTAGTALATSDFTSKSGTLSFPGTALGSSASLSIPLVNNATAEGLEHFTVKLSSPSPALGLGAIQATVAIQDDDEVFPPDGQMPAGWSVPDGFAGWIVSQDTAAAEGVYTLRNETVGDDEFAVILAEGEFAAGTVSFKVKVTSEAGFDRLRFYIDGEPKGEWSGNVTTWTLVSYPLSAGWHSLRWAYEKDGSGLVGADAAWIDSVTLPVWTPAP